MSEDELKLALKHAKRDERHLSNAETRYWCDQYKLLATQAIEALAQPEQEPVQTIPSFTQLQQIIKNLEHCLSRDSKQEFLRVWIRDWTEHKLSQNTTPLQRKPLTDEEIMNIAKVSCIGISPQEDTLNFAKVIEAVHGIKGEA